MFHVNGGNVVVGVLCETQMRPGKERQFMRVARCQSPEGETSQREVWSCSDMPLSLVCFCILGLPGHRFTLALLSRIYSHSVIIHSID